jgi:hypothetical protein
MFQRNILSLSLKNLVKAQISSIRTTGVAGHLVQKSQAKQLEKR